MNFTTEQLAPFYEIKHFKHFIKMLQKWVDDGFPDGEIEQDGPTARNPYGFNKLYEIVLNFEEYKSVQVSRRLHGPNVYTGPLSKTMKAVFDGQFDRLATLALPENPDVLNYRRVWESPFLLAFVKVLAEYN